MTPEITIAGRKVGPAHVPLVVAEIGINHEGSLEVAREMVGAAARAGVEVVKHQTHVVDDEMSGAAKQVVPGNADVSILIVAVQGLEDGQAGDPEFLASVKDAATKFTIADGETKAVDVKLSAPK